MNTEQKAVCRKYGSDWVEAPPNLKVGIARKFRTNPHDWAKVRQNPPSRVIDGLAPDAMRAKLTKSSLMALKIDPIANKNNPIAHSVELTVLMIRSMALKNESTALKIELMALKNWSIVLKKPAMASTRESLS